MPVLGVLLLRALSRWSTFELICSKWEILLWITAAFLIMRHCFLIDCDLKKQRHWENKHVALHCHFCIHSLQRRNYFSSVWKIVFAAVFQICDRFFFCLLKKLRLFSIKKKKQKQNQKSIEHSMWRAKAQHNLSIINTSHYVTIMYFSDCGSIRTVKLKFSFVTAVKTSTNAAKVRGSQVLSL